MDGLKIDITDALDALANDCMEAISSVIHNHVQYHRDKLSTAKQESERRSIEKDEWMQGVLELGIICDSYAHRLPREALCASKLITRFVIMTHLYSLESENKE